MTTASLVEKVLAGARLFVATFLFCWVVAAQSAGGQTATNFAEVRIDIDRLCDLASKGENYEESLEGIVDYIEDGKVTIQNRQYALLRLRELAAPELKETLLEFSLSTSPLENASQLRPYALIAYWATVLAEAQSESEEEEILLKALNATFDIEVKGRETPITRNALFVRYWAAEKLCQRGKAEYMGAIAEALDRFNRDPRAQERIDLCRRQIELINRFDSPLETFEFILQEVDPIAERILVDWAIRELVDQRSANLDDLLIEYVLRIEEQYSFDDAKEIYISPISILRQRGWKNSQLLERGIRSIRYFP